MCVCVCVLVADIPLDIARSQTAESPFVRWMTMDFVFFIIYHQIYSTFNSLFCFVFILRFGSFGLGLRSII